jgi:hypothetical protein
MIHCFGNSHINNFSNSNTLSYFSKNSDFVLYHLGPTISYNFYEHHFNKILQNISNVNKEIDYITIVSGEVDCRLHLPKQADIQKRTDYDIVVECLDRLFLCYSKLIEFGYKCVVYSTHPTTSYICPENKDYIYDDMLRRNNICVIWNGVCLEKCKQLNIPFISFYDILVDSNNNTLMEYYLDYCHLNSSLIFDNILQRTKSSLEIYEN